MPFSLLRYLSIYYLALCLIKNHHMHTQFTLPAPTVSVLKVHHWRQGYLCCFWLSLADAFYRCFSLKHCEGAGMHIQKTAVCTHCRTQTHYRMEFYLPINTRVPCPPRESSNKHTHTCARAHTQTTLGWWTTSAYPSLRPCPWRGCWLPPGCTVTMSSCLPPCQPLLKCIVTIRLFFFFTPAPSLTSAWVQWVPGCTRDDKMMWCQVPKLLEVFPWFGTRLNMSNHPFLLWKNNWLPVTGHFGICPSCPPPWLCSDLSSVTTLCLTPKQRTASPFYFTHSQSYNNENILYLHAHNSFLSRVQRHSLTLLCAHDVANNSCPGFSVSAWALNKLS